MARRGISKPLLSLTVGMEAGAKVRTTTAKPTKAPIEYRMYRYCRCMVLKENTTGMVVAPNNLKLLAASNQPSNQRNSYWLQPTKPSKQTSDQANRQANRQATKQPSNQTIKRPSNQASNQATKQPSNQASVCTTQ